MSSTITGTVTNTVSIGANGYTSPLTIASGGYVTASGRSSAIYSSGDATVVNEGRVGAYIGVDLKAAGYLDNSGTASLIRGYYGVEIFGAGTVTNAGTIEVFGLQTVGIGIELLSGGSVDNSGTASLIVGRRYGVFIEGSYGTVTNAGKIEATNNSGAGTGIYLTVGGNVDNTGTGSLIEGYHYGVVTGNGLSNGIGTVTNAGKIEATGGSGIGIWLRGGGTVIDSGTISGAKAILFGAGDSLLELDPGYSISGNVTAAGTGNEIELLGTAAQSALPGLSSQFIGFGTLAVAGGADWTLTGANTILSGLTLEDAGTLTVSSLVNDGTILATGAFVVDPGSFTNNSYFSGEVTLDSGSYLDNTATGTIVNAASAGSAVYGTGGAATVVDAGTIAASGSYGYGVYLLNGGTVVNSGRIAATNYHGVAVAIAGTLGYVENTGTIAGGTAGHGIGVALSSGGTIENAAGSAVISGYFYGVDINGGAGTVTNAGTIAALGSYAAVHLGDGGSIDNSGTASLIEGYHDGVYISGGAGTVTNAGTIAATGSQGYGVYLLNGGSVDNSGTIAATNGHGIAVEINGTSGYVHNSGTIAAAGSYGYGVDLNGGTVVNSGRIAATNYHGVAVQITGTPGYVENTGTIAGGTAGHGIGVALSSGGRIDNSATAALIEGYTYGVEIGGGIGTMTNAGTIAATGTSGFAVYLGDGGSLDNSGLVAAASAGGIGVQFGPGAEGTLTNSGTIEGGTAGVGIGVNLYDGGSLDNTGSAAYISGYAYGVEVQNSAGTVTNAGTIAATGAGGVGIDLQGGGTVVGSGTIVGAGGTAIAFGAGNSLLELDPGYSLSGVVTAAGTGDLLELLGTGGTVSGLGSKFEGFWTITVDSGAQWTLAGGNAILSGLTLDDAGTLTVSSLVNNGTIVATGAFVVDPGSFTNNGYFSGEVVLDAGSYLDNTGTIVKAGFAVYGTGGAATVTNAGTIEGVNGNGVFLADGGSVANSGTASLIEGSIGGVLITGGAGTVTNAGTIEGTSGFGVRLLDGGTVVDSGTISGAGGTAVYLGGSGSNLLELEAGYSLSGSVVGSGSATNILELASGAAAGKVAGLGSEFQGFGTIAVDAGAQWTLAGSNTILSGVTLEDAGTLTAGTLVNDGTIAATGAFVVDPGSFTNNGYFSGEATLDSGSYLDNEGGGTIVNAASAGSAVYGTGGAVTVVNAGTIEATGASGVGIDLAAGGTIIDSGTIGGTTAVYLGGSGGNLLELDAGYVLSGSVVASGSASNELELASSGATGTISGLATTFADFRTIAVDSGAQWSLTGSNTLGSGVTLLDDGRLTNAGSLVIGSGKLVVDPGTFTNASYVSGEVTLSGAGSYLDNTATGTIVNTAANGIAVYGTGGAVSVTNAGTIEAARGVDVLGGAGYVDNSGTIIGTSDAGVYLGAGGTVLNEAGGYIKGAEGISVGGGVGTVTNAGTILATNPGPIAGVYLEAGGAFDNTGTAALVEGPSYGVEIAGAAGTVTNAGTIMTTGAGFDAGVYLKAGGTVIDSGTIAGSDYAVDFRGTGDNLLELYGGAVLSGSVAAAGTANRLELASAAGIGTISGLATEFADFQTITVDSGARWSISAGDTVLAGVTLDDLGTLTAATLTNLGSILASGRFVDAGTFVNEGYVSGEVTLSGTGSYINNAATGTIVNTASAGIAVYGTGGAAGIVNAGTIEATGSYSTAVYLVNGGSTDNSGLIETTDGTAVNLARGGSIDNSGLIEASSGGAGIQAFAAMTVTNSGTIEALGAFGEGIFSDDGGSIDNSGTASLIEAQNAIVFQTYAGTVTNAGTIAGIGFSGVGVEGQFAGLSIGNSGLIEAPDLGVDVVGASATVTNSGTIEGTGYNGVGVDLLGGGTVIDSGTIGGGFRAIYLGGSGSNLLGLDAGYVISGSIVASGSASNELELASSAGAGTISGLSTEFADFHTITVDAGAQWTLSGGNTIAAGVTLDDLGTLTGIGTLTNAGTINGTGEFIVDAASFDNTGYVGLPVTLAGGAYLDNEAGGRIASSGIAVNVIGTASIHNVGTIEATGGLGIGINFSNSASTVTNAGTITATGAGGVGIDLASGGTVVDSGTIGGTTAIVFGGSGSNLLELDAGYVISGSVVASGSASNELELASSGATGTISGLATTFADFRTIAVDSGAQWSLSGADTLLSGATLEDFGNLINAGSLTIAGEFVVDPGTFTNASYVSGEVTLDSGSYLDNTATGTIVNGASAGIAVFGTSGAVSVMNAGTIKATGSLGAGIDLAAGGTVVDSGLVSGTTAVYLGGSGGNLLELYGGASLSGSVAAAGTANRLELANDGTAGTLSGLGGAITGFQTIAVDAGAQWTLSGSDTILAGVTLDDRGTLTAATLTNLGAILASGEFVVDPGTLVNSGYVSGKATLSGSGSYLDNTATGTIVNSASAGIAVYGTGGAADIVNAGTIEAAGPGGIGIDLAAGGTVVDSGTIGGATAVYFGGSGNNLLVLDPGYSLSGSIASGVSASNALELASAGAAGTISGLSTEFAAFAKITVDHGAQWTLAGAETIGSGVVLYDYGRLDASTLANRGSIANEYGTLVVDAGTLVNSGYIGVYNLSLAGGGYLDNEAGGRIASYYGVVVSGDGATVTNAGTITEDGYGVAAVKLTGSAGVVSNSGTIEATYTNGVGVLITGAGGSLDNYGTIEATYYGGTAVEFRTYAGYVHNTGTITALGSYGYGVVLNAGGSVGNSGTAARIEGSYDGVRVRGTLGTVTNYGTIEGSAERGVDLGQGGSVYNIGSSALIDGYYFGVYSKTGTVTNSGTIESSGATSVAHSSFYGVDLGQGGSVLNSGLIKAIGSYGVGVAIGTAGYVHNSGTIEATGYQGVGVRFAAGGTLVNGGSAAYIYGYDDGVLVLGSAGTLTNSGTISGHYRGVAANSGSIDNASGGVIYGDKDAGVGFVGGPATLTDAGAITAAGSGAIGVYFNGGGYLGNSGLVKATNTGATGVQFGPGAAGTATNSGTILGGTAGAGIGVNFEDGGSLDNSGTAAYIAGYAGGVEFQTAAGTVTNSGTIEAAGSPSAAIDLAAGGIVDNQADGVIKGDYNAILAAGSLSVTNAGVIEGIGSAGSGVVLTSGAGIVSNTANGLISGVFNGVYLHSGTVVNYGSIGASGAGGYGIDLKTGGTVVDSGLISGATAVYLGGSGSNLLEIYAGYTITGSVVGSGSAANVVELAGSAAGTISGLFADLTNFHTIAVESGAQWSLTGTNTVAAGVTLDDLGTLVNAGTLVATGDFVVDPGSFVNSGYMSSEVTLDGGSYLDNTAAGTIVNGASAGIAVYGTGGAVDVTNAGTIKATGSGGYAVAVHAGGSIENQGGGVIEAYYIGVLIKGAAGTVTNAGTIEATGLAAYTDGIFIGAGGSVDNTGLILGHKGGIGAYSVESAGIAVTNSGTIDGLTGYGIFLSNAGGSVGNSTTAALIEGSTYGVGDDGAGTVTNAGTITATAAGGIGVDLAGGGTVVDSGTIGGATAVYLGGRGGNLLELDPGYSLSGVVTAAGTGNVLELLGTGGTVSGLGSEFEGFQTIAVDRGAQWMLGGSDVVGAGVSLDNAGTLTGELTLRTGGYLDNEATGTIVNTASGGFAVAAAGTVTNAGTIEATGGVGIELVGTIDNSGTASLIEGSYGIVAGGAAGTVTNAGTIEATGPLGIDLTAGGTVVDSGTIIGAGGTAIAFLGGNSLLELDPGYSLTGIVTAAGSGNVLELLGTGGTISGIGSEFQGFQTIEAAGSAQWTLTGDNTFATLYDFGTLVNDGSLFGTIVVDPATFTNPSYMSGEAVLDAGSYLDNAGTLVNTASAGIAVYGTGGAVTVVNAGTIAASGTGGIGIDLAAGGTVVDSGTVIGAGGTAIYFGGNGNLLELHAGYAISGSVVAGGTANYLELGSSAGAGTISGLGTKFAGFQTIAVAGAARWTLAGSNTAGAGQTFEDFGSLTNAGYLDGEITVESGGYLHNAAGGTIVNGVTNGIAVYGTGGPATIVNAGTIAGAGSGGVGIDLAAGGTVVDSGTIIGSGGTAIHFGTAGSDVLELDPGYSISGSIVAGGAAKRLELLSAAGAGTISGLGTEFAGFTTIGVDKAAQWTLAGYNTLGAGATLGIAGTLTADTLVNLGSIAATGKGEFVVDPGTLVNDGEVTAAVTLDGGSYLDNTGTIAARGVAVTGSGGAVSLTNTGTIASSSRIGIDLLQGGSVDNSGSAAYIYGYNFGIDITGGAGTVMNSGTIFGTGGYNDNYDFTGIRFYDATAASATNSGTIDASHIGIYSNSGGDFSNQAGGLIEAGYAGIEVHGTTAVTVTNGGTIAATGSYGIGVIIYDGGSYLHNTGTITASNYKGIGVALISGGSVYNDGRAAYIAGIYTGVGIYGTAGTVTNAGTIAGTGTDGIGVILYDGGSLDNSGTASLIEGYQDGVSVGIYVNSTAGTVTNAGTILATGSSGVGVVLHEGGSLDNSGTAAYIAGYYSGVGIYGTAGTVTNAGTIAGTGTHGVGIDLLAGGTVVDSGTVIGAGGTAVYFGGSGSNLLELDPGYSFAGEAYGAAGAQNTIDLLGNTAATLAGIGSQFVGFQTISVAAGASWALAGTFSGQLDNAGVLLYQPSSAFYFDGTAVNTGTIDGPFYVQPGGYLTNAGTGVVSGAGTATAEALYDAGTAVNSGTIENAGAYAAVLGGGAVLSNASGGLIEGSSGIGAQISASPTIVNHGLIEGTASLGYGIVSQAGGTVTNYGLIEATASGGRGILLKDGGYVDNKAGGTIDGYAYAVAISGTAGTVANAGTIQSRGQGGVGVELLAGGSVDNSGTAAYIYGYAFGISIAGGAGTITNSGTIQAGINDAVYLSGGSIDNSGLIDGSSYGVIATAATVTNSGTILGIGNIGIALAGGSVDNSSTSSLVKGLFDGIRISGTAGTVTNAGTIAATGSDGIGIDLAGGGTVVDSGTIIGGLTAVYLGGTGSNLLELYAGYKLIGGIAASASTTNTLELAGTAAGTLTGLGSEFAAFQTIAVAGGADWTLAGSNTFATLHDSGTLVNDGSLFGTIVVDPATFTNPSYMSGEVVLDAGSYLDNTGTLVNSASAGIAVYGTGGAVSIVNAGTIAASGSGGVGIDLAAGGTIDNSGTASLIEGSGGVKIVSAGTVTNAGTIDGRSGYGVALYAGGSVDNTAGLIEGRTGVLIDSGAGTVTNAGTIDGTSGLGVQLEAGGSVDNSGTASLIEGGRGVVIVSAGTVTNAGTIEGTASYGVHLGAGGSVYNDGRAAYIAGFYIGVGIYGAAGTVTNAGTIEGTSDSYGVGIGLVAGGSVYNDGRAAYIAGGVTGVAIYAAAGTVTNSGTIEGTSGRGVYLSAGGTVADSGTIIGGGGEAIYFGGTGANLLELEAGYKISGRIVGSGSATNTLELSGSLGAVTASYGNLGLSKFQTVDFGADYGHAETLKLSETSGTFGLTIAGFASVEDKIDLTQLGNFVSDRLNGDLLTVTGASGTVTLDFASLPTGFAFGNDGSGGTFVGVACFCRGTRILTVRGEVAVEDLAIGEEVVTLGGRRPIKWIGRRSFDGRFIRGNTGALPIAIGRGALGDGVPHRDLRVSPGHAMWFPGADAAAGVLVKSEDLLNGTTIRQEREVEAVEYFHIEFESHEILIAEGAFAESYAECDNRGQFHNAAEFARLYPDDARPAWAYSAPFIEAAALAELREGLRARAGELGWDSTPDPDLHLFADGVRLDPERAEGECYLFRLSGRPDSLRLVSRAAMPYEVGINDDRRRLGLCLRRITMREPGLALTVGFDEPSLEEGFHEAETEEGHIWTDGDALLPARFFGCFSGEIEIEIEAGTLALYPVPGPAALAAPA